MENAINLAEYIKLTGIVVAVGAIIVGYWIKEIKVVRGDLDVHRTNDSKEFQDAERANDAVHAELRREMGQVKGSAELAIAGLKGDLNTMSGTLNGKLDTLIGLFKDKI